MKNNLETFEHTQQSVGDTPEFLRGGGEMGALMRAHDWSNSSLGPAIHWPPSLRTVVRLILNTGHPMYIWWGADGACLYNDAYRKSIGPERHPGSLGRPAREVWEEIWPIIGPQIDQVMSGRGATSHVNQLVPITRYGKREDVYWTYSYSPIDDETVPGGIGGVLVICAETTQQVLAARRAVDERDQLAQLFEKAPTFMALLRDSEHRFEIANPSYMQLVEHRPLLGKTVAEVLPEIAGQGYIALLDQVFASGEAYTAYGSKCALQTIPGGPVNERYLDFVYQPMLAADGKVAGIFVVGNDVTDQVLSTKELERVNQELAETLRRQKEAEWRQACQLELADSLRPLISPEDIISTASEFLGQRLHVARVFFYEVNNLLHSLKIRRDWCRSDMQSLAGSIMPLNDFGPEISADLRAGKVVRIADVLQDSRTVSHADAYARFGGRAILSIPLVKAGCLSVVLNLHQPVAHEWTDEEIQMAHDVAERTWAAVESAWAQAELRAERDQSQYIFDSMAEGFGLIDDNWNVVQMNAAGLQLVKRAAADVIGHNHWDIFPETLGTAIEYLCRTVKETGVAGTAEYNYQDPTSQKRWMEIRIYPALDNGLAVFFRDISIRRDAEDSLKETADRLQFTLDSAEMGDWDLDLVNDKAYRSLRHDQCFGYKEPIPEWGFEIFLRHVHPEDQAFVKEQFLIAIENLGDWHFECRVVWPDGSIHWIGAHGSIFHVDSTPTRMSGIVFDITKRKHTEEELRKEAHRKDEFLAMLAHELRNPLAPIGAAADLLSLGRFDESHVRHTSEIIRRQVGHMTSLIDDLLDVSRVTRGLVSLDKTPVDVKMIVADAVEQVRPLIEARKHRLEVHLAPEHAVVEGDTKRLVQVLANLLSNAAKYTPESGRIVLQMDVSPDQVTLSVIDNGIGMLQEVQNRAFELFAQAERTSDRSQGGLGIGLALVKSLVELHQGAVSAHSQGPGKGSTFAVTLPRLAHPLTNPFELDNASTALPAANSALTVMVVDDNVDAAQALTMFLESVGYKVAVEYHSRKALERARNEVFDVCMLDIGLQDMDGNELARQLRALPHMTDTVLIAITGYGQPQDRQTAFTAGFNHHFVKPVDASKLLAILAALEKSNGTPS